MLKSLFGGAQTPPPPHIEIRDTLFGDLPVDNWLGNGSASFPWSAFVEARARLAAGDREGAMKHWREVVAHPGLEPRHYLQAWHFLREHGEQPRPEIAKQLLGVVVEVGMEGGLDLLAAYPDHSARYYNYSGSGVVWEHPDTSMDDQIDALLAASARVVQHIGPWDKPRRPAPGVDQVRLNFLTPSGLHFGQAGLETMSTDPIGGQVLNCAAALMNALIEKSLSQGKRQ